MIEFGYFSFCFALLLSAYALLTGIVCLVKPYVALLTSARNAIVGVFLCVFTSSLILWHAIFTHDFSVRYVYMHSAVNMPPVYLFTSFWSALEGSHLLWTLIMSFVSAVTIASVRKKNEIYYPGLCVALATPLTFMLLLNVTISAPFNRLFPAGTFGLGMNALLQNPFMAIHPPMLFSGYSLLIIPFAYSFAALCRGYFTQDWFLTVRRASLIAWIFLTIAIFLGGKWAYCELGWGGYWGWDPVENSSFMPWLSLTAALHTFLIYNNTKRLPRLGLFLLMLSFALSFQGTFITRSGIISSVHSFAESDIGPAYLTWILFLFVTTVFLVFTRGSLLEGAAKENEWKWSKETTLLFTIFFLLFMLALVFTGTILPLVVEAVRGIKISIQQPFFNSFTPWIGLGFLAILGLGHVMKWKTGKISDGISALVFPAFWSLLVTLTFVIQKQLSVKVSVAYFLIFWNIFILIMDLVYRLKDLHWNGKAFLKYQRSFLGALLVHIGFLMAVLGFTGNYQTTTAEVNLKLNQSTQFHGYELTNKGLDYAAEYNVQTIHANIQANNPLTQTSTVIAPKRSKFTNNEQWFNEVGVYSTFWHDIYLVLASFDIKTQSVSLKMNYNPTVKFVWTSLVVCLLGILISLTQRNKSENQPQTRPHRFVSLLTLIFIVACVAFAYSGIALGQEAKSEESMSSALLTQGSGNGLQLPGKQAENGQQIPMQTNPKLVEVAKELRCPTCLGMSILESGTPQSLAMRTEIAKQLAQGKSKKEIIDYFKSRYGSWILREPDLSSSTGFLIWFIPILGLLCGPLFILIGVKKSQRKRREKRAHLRKELEKIILDMQTKEPL